MKRKLTLNVILAVIIGIAWIFALGYGATADANFAIAHLKYMHYTSNHLMLHDLIFYGVISALFALLVSFLRPKKIVLYGAITTSPLIIFTVINAVTFPAAYWTKMTPMVLFGPTVLSVALFVVILRLINNGIKFHHLTPSSQ